MGLGPSAAACRLTAAYCSSPHGSLGLPSVRKSRTCQRRNGGWEVHAYDGGGGGRGEGRGERGEGRAR